MEMKKFILIIALFLGGCSHMRPPMLNGRCPRDFPIKGNADSGVYHTSDSRYYYLTVPEFCFASEEVARLRGFVKYKK